MIGWLNICINKLVYRSRRKWWLSVCNTVIFSVKWTLATAQVLYDENKHCCFKHCYSWFNTARVCSILIKMWLVLLSSSAAWSGRAADSSSTGWKSWVIPPWKSAPETVCVQLWADRRFIPGPGSPAGLGDVVIQYYYLPYYFMIWIFIEMEDESSPRCLSALQSVLNARLQTRLELER